jgi:alpha-methylacyl-CoA racemase
MGPLEGVKVVELGGIGPGPFTAMLLADMGAEVIRIDRAGAPPMFPPEKDPTLRGRTAVAVDLKHPDGVELVLSLCEGADALLEGFRPGVMERLGLGPDVVLERAPQLVFGRMTGWGQTGPLAPVAGHDVNYISVAGALGAIRRAGEKPLFPLNLVGDYGGGGMFLAFGLVCGILEARRSGKGQVLDVAMVDGTAVLTTLMHGLRALGAWKDEPGVNLLDSGAHFYEVYETADGGHVSVGAIEPQFYAKLLELLELDPAEVPQHDPSRWPELKSVFAARFREKTAEEWGALLEHEDACATVVRNLHDAPQHPHMAERGAFVELDGVL